MIAHRRVSLVAVPLGALAALTLMFRVGRGQSSLVLILLFTIWVAAPFVAMMSMLARAGRRSPRAQGAISKLALLLTAMTVMIYGAVAWGAVSLKPAFMFLMVPLLSLLVIRIAAALQRKLHEHA